MPTVLANLESVLEGGALSGSLDTQIGNLGAIVTTVTNLIEHPPDDIGDILGVLQAFPLPDIGLGGDFTTTLHNLQAALPADLSSVTGTLTGGLTDLQDSVGTDFVEVLNGALQAALAIYNLTQIDFTCATPPGSPPPPPPPDGNGGNGGGNGSPPPQAAATVAQMNGALDLLPSPFNVDGLLTFLHGRLNAIERDVLGPISIPLLDDLQAPLDTLMTWKLGSGADVQAQIADTLTDLDGFVRAAFDGTLTPLTTDLNALAPGLPATQLGQLATDIVARLNEINAAVTGGDVSGTGAAVTALNNLLDQYDALQANVQSALTGQLNALQPRLVALPGSLETRMGALLSVLQPDVSLNLLDPLTAPLDGVNFDAIITGIADFLGTITAWLQDLLEKIDLSVIQAPLTAVADALETALDGLDDSMVSLTLTVQNLFGEVEALLDAIDLDAVRQQVEDAIDAFKDEVIGQLQTLFEPARDAVALVVTQIDSAVDAFDPEAIIGALEDAINSIAGVLNDPAVADVINSIREGLEAVKDALEALSFAPIVDEVIDGIEAVGEGVRSVAASDISPILKEALQAALAVVPSDLSPIINPLIDSFGEMVEGGPVPVLEAIKDQPKQLVDRVREFDPATLVGDALNAPFEDLLEQMEQFQPSALLQPVRDGLDTLKDRLRENGNPGLLIEPLEPLFDELMAAFDALDPAAIVEPLNEAIATVTGSLTDALPLDEVFDQIEAALNQVQRLLAFGNLLKSVLDKAKGILEGFSDAPGQITAWLDPILGKIDALGDMGSLQPLLVNITGAVQTTMAAALSARFNAAADPMLAALTTLDPLAKLTAIVQAHRVINVSSLPDSPEKTAIVNALNRMSPTQPAFGVSFQTLNSWRQTLADAKGSLQALLTNWDATYHGAGSVLASLRDLQATPANLRAWITSVLEPTFIAPLTKLFSLFEPLAQMVGVLADEVGALMDELQARIGGLITGPNSLASIKDSMQALIDRLENFNLDFLTDNLNDLFGQVRDKLQAASPAALREIIETAFDDMLDALDLNLILPQEDIEALDNTYQEVLDKLRDLSPQELVTAAVRPLWEEIVVPLVDIFDITPFIEAIIEKLQALDDELRSEMERVNQAFESMKQSVQSAGISMSV